MKENILKLYHGSDHIVAKPEYGKGKGDNDYGSGFYTTADIDRAKEWASVNGDVSAVCNAYEINTDELNVLQLDDYGPLAWIAEIITHRGARGELSMVLANKFIERYKIDTSNADIIIGYRADDSYMDIVDAFLQNQLNVEEVERLFHKGNLGKQVFIKSEKAFHMLQFKGYEYVDTKEITNETEIRARMEVSKFLRTRATQIQLNGFEPNGILAKSSIANNYIYDLEYKYYYAENLEIKNDEPER